MAIDYDAILGKFIRVAADGVGDQLSLIDGTHPSVIRARQKPAKPDYPYVVLDLLQTRQEAGWLFNEGIDLNGNKMYETHYELLLNYTVYGYNDAVKIAHDLETYFRLERVRNSIETEVEVLIVNTNPVISLPQKLADKWVESSSFSLVVNVNDRYVDVESDGFIDTVDIDGELKEGEDDPNPIPIDIVVTTP